MTGSILGNIFYPVFGGVFGYGVGSEVSWKVTNFTETKIKNNLEELKKE